jgi:glycosyltransferase involved in cell wall biosynthesis
MPAPTREEVEIDLVEATDKTIARQVPAYRLETFHPKRGSYAVVVPVWNEGSRLLDQLARMRQWCDAFDIVISDKPSTDGSTAPDKLRAVGVHALVSLTERGGLSSSLRAAFAYALDAGYLGVVVVDGNDKDDPDALPRFAAEFNAGLDYVQGSRYCAGGKAVNTPLNRDLLIRFVHAPLFSLLAGYRFTDTTNGFRGFSRRFLLDSRVAPFRSAFDQYELPYYLAWAASRKGFRVREIPVTRSYPASGPTPTKITLIRGNWRMLKPLLMLMLRQY